MNIFFILLFSLCTFAAEDFGGKDGMNGIDFKTYKDFPSTWKLVTIRFRKDTGEMRLTYANDIAFKTLESGGINYPDGAVFAKTGINTGVDPQFESSVVPSGIRRYQLMVKDKKKYSTTHGWGYGLFDPDGKTFAEDPVVTQNACFACHTIVENRGDVFSQPFNFTKAGAINFSHTVSQNSQINFEWRKISSLPDKIKNLIPKKFVKVRFVKNELLRKNTFQGTLDEMRPLLESETRKNKSPSLFASIDMKRFVIVHPSTSDKCMGEGSMVAQSTDMKLNVIVDEYCTHD